MRSNALALFVASRCSRNDFPPIVIPSSRTIVAALEFELKQKIPVITKVEVVK
jgi:hypothetical protein